MPGPRESRDAERGHERDYQAVTQRLSVSRRQGLVADDIVEAVQRFEVALPSWAFATGRHALRPIPRRRRAAHAAREDRGCRRSSTGSPAPRRGSRSTSRGTSGRPAEVRADATPIVGIGFDAMNSNTFQDQPGQPLSYKLGSFSNPERGGAQAGDRAPPARDRRRKGAGLEGAHGLARRRHELPRPDAASRQFDRVRECLQEVYAALPNDWRLFTEHKPYEPAFYATVVQDWGSSLLLAQALGDARAVPRRPRPPPAERQHRAGRRAAPRRRAPRRASTSTTRSTATTISRAGSIQPYVLS